MVINCRNFERNIQKKGFKFYNGKKHKKYIFEYKGMKTNIIIEVSHNCDELRDPMINMLTKEMKFNNKNDFCQFAECILTELKYIEILKSKKIIN